jgi:ubiquinone biosynthesis UbiH/UbiF/VisC/COQ6 family hydroxylase
MDADIIIVGAGPSGLCLAQSLSGQGISVVLVEAQTQSSLAQPEFDGREIALTQHSVALLKDLGLWSQLAAQDLSPLRDAKIMNGLSPCNLLISHKWGSHPELGWLVSNHLIRKAAYDCVLASQNKNGDIQLISGQRVARLSTQAEQVEVTLDNGTHLTARLVVSADSRFSSTRRMMGIPAQMHDFGKNMLVCCMSHEQPHDHVAWEWFDFGQTLALLPMNPDPTTGMNRSSVVITLPSEGIDQLMQAEVADFEIQVRQRFHDRLGSMHLLSTRHNYPLVGVYPERLTALRYAAVGDAAVGMHPVTAHGFNFGLLGIEALSKGLLQAHQAGHDVGNARTLAHYNRQHQMATRPLYLLTRWLTDLYTHESVPGKLLRETLLRVAQNWSPIKKAIARSLTGNGHLHQRGRLF